MRWGREMEGKEHFLKMMEIDKHLRSEAEWWRGEGCHPDLVAQVFESVARYIRSAQAVPQPMVSGETWAEQWGRASSRLPRPGGVR